MSVDFWWGAYCGFVLCVLIFVFYAIFRDIQLENKRLIAYLTNKADHNE